MTGLNKNPLVSICIPAYNGSRFIKKAIRSSLDQTYENIEIVVIDDGSFDDTAKIVQDLARKDGRVKFFENEKNIGVAENFLACYKKAQGEYIQHLNQDDWLDADLIERKVEAFRKHSDIAFVFNASRGYKKGKREGEISMYAENKNHSGFNSKEKIFKNFYKDSGYIGIMAMSRRRDLIDCFSSSLPEIPKYQEYYKKGMVIDVVPFLKMLADFSYKGSYSIDGSFYNVFHHSGQAGNMYGFDMKNFDDFIEYQKVIDAGFVWFFEKYFPREISEYKTFKCQETAYSFITGFVKRSFTEGNLRSLIDYWKSNCRGLKSVTAFLMLPVFIVKKILKHFK